jgi:hypothetical protein
MKNTIKLIAALAVAAIAFTQTSSATPITGTIGFSGTANLDGSSVATSSQVLSWGTNTVGITSGSFSGVPIGAVVTLIAPWSFNSGARAGFWQVAGFTFDLAGSSIFQNSGGFLSINLVGTVFGNGYEVTALSGRVTIQDPSVSNGRTFNYTESLSFNSVPDGGTTALLLGSALSGLALIRRKLTA